ncbi:hypothetical protein NHE_0673 [Neorickettsia helminthoeca str. Oregon]|uniref:Uncharacterized protein n=1 Tax=Neorickettsia helminthoeca str. Oregon TaxID=1286528 RepID=X5H4W4_9RICK|nr:hypothetical protein [Neorickettsia helminthoeca]AHX11606.1 hypothetical protein NHE_0673 [Neorickettsia helminthoeca str. Oregon]
MADDIKNNDSDLDLDLESLSEEYMASVQEQIKKFTENPEMLQKALGPFMKLQSEYMKDPEKLGSLMSGLEGGTEESFKTEVQESLKRLRARLAKMDKRLDEIMALLSDLSSKKS